MIMIHKAPLETSRQPALPYKNIIVYGDCWPVVSAISSIAEIIMPDCHFHSCYSINVLKKLQKDISDARFIFCLRPREHVCLFYFLTHTLSRSPLLVITDSLLPTDRVVLKTSACAVTVNHSQVYSLYTSLSSERHCQTVKENALVSGLTLLTEPGFISRVEGLPMVFSNGIDLISFMNECLQQYMQQKGVTRLQLKILEKMRSEPTLKSLATTLDISIKNLSYNKAYALNKLGVAGKDYLAMYGTHFCQKCQKTSFSVPTLRGRI
ncbi:hypothetical protein XU01_002249 [Salmonella enterica subsp. enterica serovar Oranienburg]|nr:hypothetical protein [Salmonella enterica subsp. enterica serovar Oranienburg]EDQ9924113.1 hypothetical protein [Salmonella enterica subsp. enterica serovar Oranienburg]EDW2554703.1 hypothetical protein [Salmonella enterica subsp. enterica serovar Oranienburg]EDW6160811.1 hypothetical protein [Salmonella enterica subsp. enterica serovar Oranienburg]